MEGIRTITEGKRGCGFRKPGGTYLMGEGEGRPCGRLPFPLERCPVCSEGFPFSRTPKWVNVNKLVEGRPCGFYDCDERACPLRPGGEHESLDRVLLLWVGAKHYATPEEFADEAAKMGISRRINYVPKGFKVGEHYVVLAHVKVRFLCDGKGDDCERCHGSGFEEKPGAFRIFMPNNIEYVIKGTETDEELEAMRERGIEPVIVQKEPEAQGEFREPAGIEREHQEAAIEHQRERAEEAGREMYGDGTQDYGPTEEPDEDNDEEESAQP